MNVVTEDHVDPLAISAGEPVTPSPERFPHHRSSSNNPAAHLVIHCFMDGCLPQPQQEQVPDHTSVSSSRLFYYHAGPVANLCSATLGAGVLSLPFALYQAGLVCGIVLLLVAALATEVSIRILVESCDSTGLKTYEALVQRYSPVLRRVLEVCIAVFCCGTAVAYNIAVGDILQQGQLLLHGSRQLSMVLCWLVVMLPLSMLRTMHSLQFASGMGLASIGTLVFATFIHLMDNQGDNPVPAPHQSMESLLWPAHGVLSVLTACPIVLFAFSCQCNVCAIYEELDGPNRLQRMRHVTYGAVLICTFLYTSISIIALVDFGNAVTPNILTNYQLKGIMQVAVAAMAAAVILAFPLNIFPARTTVAGMLFANDDKKVTATTVCASLTQALLDDQDEEQVGGHTTLGESSPLLQRSSEPTAPSPDKELSMTQHVVLTLILAGSALGLALVVPNISVVFGLLGGTTTSVLGFIVPGYLGIQLCKEKEAPKFSYMNVASYLLLFGGFVVGILTTAVTVFSTISEISRQRVHW